MKKDTLKAQIIDTLDAIIEQTQIIVKHQGEIPQIEIDLVKKNILELYENFHFLDKMNDVYTSERIEKIIHKDDIKSEIEQIEEIAEIVVRVPSPTEIEEIEQIEQIEQIEEIATGHRAESRWEDDKIEEIAEPITEDEIVTQEEFVEEQIVPEVDALEESKPKTEVVDNQEQKTAIQSQKEIHSPNLFEAIEEPKPVMSEIKKEEKVNIQTELFAETPKSQSTVADKFKSEKKSINDLIERNDDKSVASKLQKAPIQDLVKAIGLNDRFLLTKELFKNNAEHYNKSIKELNEMPSLDEAFNYLDDLKANLEWDESSSSCLKIYDLIRRKYQNKK